MNEKDIRWFKDQVEISPVNTNKKTWNLGSSTKDPRGIYWCQGSKNLSKPLQAIPLPYHPQREQSAALDRGIISGEKNPEQLSHLEGSLSFPFPTVCQNCIELNSATVSGFIFAEIISIFLLAVGVYYIAGQEGVRQSRGKRMLLDESLLPTKIEPIEKTGLARVTDEHG
ncbi:hypothetical protein E2I00_019237, partial [Balaenoptera physalus]